MDITPLLKELGVGIASSAVYDAVRGYFRSTTAPTIAGLKETVRPILNIAGADVVADRVIDFLARNGDIRIVGTSIYASESITMSSSRDTRFDFGHGSTSRTDKSSIAAGLGANITGTGGAKIEQTKDGGIRFSV
ncbi:MAG: hemagglutinin repeat-containing protein [Patescibacteria group bacterium]